MDNFSDAIEWLLTSGVLNLIIIGFVIYLILLWIALIIWVTKDIISRTNNIVLQMISIFLVTLLNVFGLLIYVAIRPSKTLIEKFFEDLEYEALVQETKKEEEPKKTSKKIKETKKTRKK